MKILIRVVLIAALAALGAWLWTVLHPGPEKIIRSRLVEVARNASFTGQEGNFARVTASQNLSDSFTTDGQVVVDFPGVEALAIEGRDQVFRLSMYARSQVKAAKVEFLDFDVALGPDMKAAQVELTAKVFVPWEKGFVPLELKFSLKQLDGVWLITRVESVKVLN